MSDVDEAPMTPRPTGNPTPKETPADPKPTGSGDESHPAADDSKPTPSATPRVETAPPPAEAAPAGEAGRSEDVPLGAKVVRRVVCGYQLGSLPADWLQTWRRLGRLLAARELNVTATLAALEALPSDTDILVVPPELREAAREAAEPGTPLLITPASAADGAFGELASRLLAGADFTAERLDPPASASVPPTALEGAAR